MTVVSPAVEPYPDASTYVDVGITEALHNDPITPFMEFRELGPVVKREADGTINGVPVPNSFILPDGERDIYWALSYEAVQSIMKNHEGFSSFKAFEESLVKTSGPNLTSMDEPEHRYYRKLVMPSFSRRSVNQDIDTIAEQAIRRVMDEVIDQGEAEIMSTFTVKFPFSVVATLFGVPLEIEPECLKLNAEILLPGEDMARAQQSKQKLDSIYKGIIDDHRAHGTDSLTKTLIETTVEGDRLSDDEICMFIFQLMNAGLDTTARQMASLLFELLEHPEQFELLKSDPDQYVDKAIRESLRTTPAATATCRVANDDIEVCGVMIPKDAGVYLSQITSNRDEKRWPDPTRFDITRDIQPFLAFGNGNHTCMGMHLALLELRIALRMILERMPKFRKDERRWASAKMAGFHMRSPTQLPVRWD